MAKHYYIEIEIAAILEWIEIFPSNDPVAVKTQIEGTHVWREEVDEIKLPKTSNSSVYDALHPYFIDKTKFDNEIEIEIYEGTRASGTLYWKGLFSISDTEDNFQNTVASLKPLRINDNYRTILEKADRQYELDIGRNILEHERIGYSEPITLPTGWTNPVPGYHAFTTFIASGGSISTAIANATGISGAYLGLGIAFSDNDIVIVDISSFNAGAVMTFDITDSANNSATDEGPKGIGVQTMAWTMNGAEATPRLQLLSQPGTTDMEFTMRVIQTENDHPLGAELILDFVETYLTSSLYMHLTGYTGNVVSTFLDNDSLPTGAPSSIVTFMGSNPNGNYVTEEATNELNSTLIGLLIEWFGDNKTSFKMSFNDIMTQFREMFNIYWFIDGDGKFRLEHEKYFVRQVTDSTPIDISNHATAEVDAKIFNYNKSAIGAIETFQWAQAGNTDFVGQDIVYNNFETTNRPIDHALNYITTDIQYVIDNLSEASNSGLGIYNCSLLTGITGADIYEIIISNGALTASAFSNAAFSWANLHEHYWSWSRMSENATINGAATSMNSSIRFLEQKNVRFFYSTAIDPFTLIQTSLTGAAPIEIKRDLETDYIELILGYDPYKL